MQATSLKFSCILAGFVLATGCGSKTEPTAAAPQPVEQKTVASAPANPTVTAKAPSEPAAKPADEHAACGDHAGAAPAAGEKDCPFDDEKKAEAKAGEHEACGHGGEAQAAATPTKDGDALHFGQAFSIPEAKPLSVVLASAPAADAAVRVSGKIEKVCKKMGCWMVVKDGDKTARVIMKDHAFTVPMDSEGKSVNVEGTLKSKTFTAAQSKHLMEDGGEDPSKPQGETTEFVLTATAVNIGG